MTRKVLPQEHSFATVAGHDVAKSYLRHAMDGDLLPHAMLFHGPAGIGKLSVAYSVIKQLNCREDSPEGCGCDMCRKISENKFADVLLVEPRGVSGQITLSGWRPGKDDPDNLQYYRFVETRPLEGSRKVLILRHAERMNVALANYILKLMEEPPAFLSMILVSNRKSDLLPTIRSRCAGVKFSPLSFEEMRQYAAARDLSPDAADVDLAIRQSEGRPALLAEKLGTSDVGDQEDLAAAMLSFKQYGFVSLFRVASDMIDLGESGGTDAASRFDLSLQQMTNWFRDATVVKMNAEVTGNLLTFPRLRAQLLEFADGLSHLKLLEAADAIGRYRNLSRRQIDKNYALECLLMEIGRIVRG